MSIRQRETHRLEREAAANFKYYAPRCGHCDHYEDEHLNGPDTHCLVVFDDPQGPPRCECPAFTAVID